MLDRPFGDLVLAGEPHAWLRSGIGEEAIEHAHPIGMTGDTVMATAAIALRAVLPETNALTASERQLLSEWLDRIASRVAARHR